jgi:hypothetical protein
MALHYDTDEKKAARQFIVDFVSDTDVAVKRVFTLPSVYGLCAQRFKAEYPGCHITGIERERMIVLHSDLVIGDGPDTYGLQCLDAFYLANTADLVNGGVIEQRVYRKADNLDQKRAPKSIRVSPDIGKFDLIFLDYTATPSNRLRDEVNIFVGRFANKPSVVAVTCTLNGADNSAATGMFPGAEFYEYMNERSRMCVMAWEHK